MFVKKPIIVACFIAIFGINEVLAASISTRVRVLESKVAKQEKVIQGMQGQYKQVGDVKAELSKIRSLEVKVDQLLKAQETKQQKTAHGEDKRYAFP